jgi:hypothetical protein
MEQVQEEAGPSADEVCTLPAFVLPTIEFERRLRSRRPAGLRAAYPDFPETPTQDNDRFSANREQQGSE